MAGRDSARRIVVVDDDPDFRDLLTEILSGDFATSVTTLVGVSTGLHEVLAAQPDLLIVDALLSPDQSHLSGWDIAELTRQHRLLRSVPIIVVTADAAGLREQGKRMTALGIERLLAKPFSLEELVRAVAELLPPADSSEPATRASS